MAFQSTQNTFNQGMNKDSDHRVQANSTYSDAKNISITGESEFFAAKNIAGSQRVIDILPQTNNLTDIQVLGAFECTGTFYSYGPTPERNPAIIMFLKYDVGTPALETDVIVLYDLKKNQRFSLLTTNPVSVDHREELAYPENGTIDAIVFGEKNFDRIYFDDHTNPLRNFDITDQPIPNARSLTTRPLAPVDEISYVRQIDGSGENQSGTYQFAYRYYNTDTLKYSHWSLMTLPIPVYPLNIQDVTILDEIYGGVPNEATKKSIVLSIAKSTEYSLNFNAIQLAVIKNTTGLKQPAAIAHITSIREDWFNDPSNIVYDGQGLETIVDSQEIVTEDAAILSAKTLVAKDNVLFRGNIKYRDLTVDSITFRSANTISEKLGTSSTSYSLTRPNTNNPSFNHIDGSFPGISQHDGAGNPVDTRYVLPYPTGLDIREGSGGFFGNVEVDDGRMVGSSVDGDVPDDRANLVIPTNITAGNEIFLKIFVDGRGMREWPATSPFNDEWGFQAAVLGGFADLDLFDHLTSAFGQLLRGQLFFGLLTASSNQETERRLVTDSFRYIVQPGEDAATVAKNIQEQLAARMSASEWGTMTRTGNILHFRVRNVVTRNPFGPNNSFKPIMFLEYGIGNGIDTTPQDDTSDINDLITNPDSKFGGYKNPANSHRFKGYWRDEVYRFGLTYMDKFGNWSRPVPFDFSSLNARNETGTTHNVSLVQPIPLNTGGGASGLTNLHIGNHTITKGDIVKVEFLPGLFDYPEVRTVNGNAIGVGNHFEQPAGFIVKLTELRGGEFSHADTGTDWKFPARKNFKFPMMSSIEDNGDWDENNTFINPIGLRVEGITNHPEWAVSLAIVRVRRLKNVIWQSPAITTQAVMPSLYAADTQDFCANPIAGSSPSGTYGPKSFAKGVSFHIDRLSPGIGINDSFATRRRPIFSDENIPKLIVVVPPEYMYQNDGANFGSGITPSGANLQIVDAVTYFRTPEFDVDGSGADDGDSAGDQLAFGIRADNAYNYYYKDTTGFLDVDSYQFARGGGNQFAAGQLFNGGQTRALFYSGIVNNGSAATLPAPPADFDFRLKQVVTYGNLEATSTYNCSNEVTLQKQIVILTEDNFGDFSYYARNAEPSLTLNLGVTPIGRADFAFHYEPARADINVQGSSRFNVGKSGFQISNNASFELAEYIGPGNRITDLIDGASCAAPIVNLVRGIADDRYGKLEDVHQYIHTGAYAKISSTSDVIDLDVWGGDCFISRHVAKISDTHVDKTSFGVSNVATRVFAYHDFQEVLMTYQESEVNCEMQAGQFHYPVLQRQALQVFSPQYNYPYNPGYSVENELKIWVSRSNVEQDRFEFPARIAFSDQKVFQTDIEGFDRFRANSFYDLPEDFGGITKLTKLPNDNVYTIQESAVAVLPINKNVIEDSTGGQLVVNSGTLINQPSYIMNENGSQHIRSVVNSDTHIFFMDANKREIFKIGGGGQDGKISDNGMHSEMFRQLESHSGIPDHKVVSGYDFNNNEYWIGVNSYEDTPYESNEAQTIVTRPTFHYVWSDKLGAWMTEMSLNASTEARYLVYSHSLYYMLGTTANGELALEAMYEGDVYGRMLGQDNESSIKFVVNPDEPFGKTFDVLRIDSSNRLDRATAVVHRENPLPPLTTDINLNRQTRHDSYEVPMLLAQGNQRIRGKACEIEMFMTNGNTIPVEVVNVLTKYRMSSRIFR